MHIKILAVVLSIVVTSASPIISEKNEGSSNNLISLEQKPTLTLESSVTPINKNEGALEAPLTGYRMMKSRKIDTSGQVEARKKSKLKKAFLPIIIFVLIKALIFIPLALGILAFKSWNAIQLSFVSFVTAAALAFWKFCTKVNQDEHPAVIHGGWDLDRSDPQLLAYNGYVPY